LVWLVHGSMRYFKEGLDDIDDTIQKATNNYMEENDDIGNFIKEFCEIGRNYYANYTELYSLYRQNTDSNLTPKAFSNKLKDLGYICGKKNHSRAILGLQLKNTEI